MVAITTCIGDYITSLHFKNHDKCVNNVITRSLKKIVTTYRIKPTFKPMILKQNLEAETHSMLLSIRL